MTGQLPAIVIIARHGARLDAADNQWHLTSPTTYDPPLTFGGWTQSRALGARIASVLHARETSNSFVPANANGSWSAPLSPVVESTRQDGAAQGGNDKTSFGNGYPKRRKHRVIIHTSPYLRCLQTSIAISAGMAQYHGTFQSSEDQKPTQSESSTTSSNSEFSIPEGLSPLLPANQPFTKPLLRIDAFLGEWLNPDYFEHITPPPDSVMMVASAKAEMLRRGDYTDLDVRPSGRIRPGFPGGWGSAIETETDSIDEPLSNLSHLARVLPRRDRTSSHSTTGTYGNRTNIKGNPLLTGLRGNNGGYVAPTPSYLVSASDPIPAGYVAHARDACTDVDYQWDSMREPLAWGDGGEYGEEWSTMHKRCRKALQKMLSWYKAQDPSDERRRLSKGISKDDSAPSPDPDANIATDTVIILVSHGAACNAFIGGLTDSPVLLDVGMASLTLAIRKDHPKNPPITTNTGAPSPPVPLIRRNSSTSLPASDDYEVKLIASTDHLRAGPGHHLIIPQLQTSNLSPTSSQSPRRHRYGSNNNSVDESHSHYASERAPRSATSSALGSIRRSSHSSTPIPLKPSTTPARTSPNGLWSRPTSSGADSGDEAVVSSNDATNSNGEYPSGVVPKPQSTLPDRRGHLDRKVSQRGLWGSSPLTERDKGAKRRWTVNEQAS
ncbi:MAG: hypothetical protein M1816_001881 [Peltula sp. TS41687]|nr:MAG: hypothetical protein M1816_001881 [Peltula sp. TS41687]